MPHSHTTRVEGCFRCDLSADEVALGRLTDEELADRSEARVDADAQAFLAAANPLFDALVESVVWALADQDCDLANGDGFDRETYAQDATIAARAVVGYLAWSAVAEQFAAVRGQGEALQRVRELADEWEAKAGPESSAWEVFGPQKVGVPFAVEKIRAALDGPVR